MADGFQSHPKFPKETTSPWIDDAPIPPERRPVGNGQSQTKQPQSHKAAKRQSGKIRKSVSALVVMRRVGNIFVFNRSGD
jgi:hypothetical protein